MQVDVWDTVQMKPVSQRTLPERVFARPMNKDLVHQVVVAKQANIRAGTAQQKTRAEVRGGGRKPWAQKGRGHARAGSIRSPLWRKGGVTFAAKPRSFKQKINKKAYRASMQVIVSELLRAERMQVVTALSVEAPKTKQGVALLAPFAHARNKLLVDVAFAADLYLACRNIPHVLLVEPHRLEPVVLVHSDLVLITEQALQVLEERLA